MYVFINAKDCFLFRLRRCVAFVQMKMQLAEQLGQ
jgi:hypothetical protein